MLIKSFSSDDINVSSSRSNFTVIIIMVISNTVSWSRSIALVHDSCSYNRKEAGV